MNINTVGTQKSIIASPIFNQTYSLGISSF